MRTLIAIAALLAFAVSRSASASFYTGNDLLELCEGSEAAQNICRAYIGGISDGRNISYLRQSFLKDDMVLSWHCERKEGVTLSQLQRIVVKYMNEHPHILHGGAQPIVSGAFYAYFRCDI